MTFKPGHKTNSPWRQTNQSHFAKEQLTCALASCGKQFHRQRSAPHGAHSFCSVACANAFKRKGAA